jgi:hypothetical protein
LGSRSHAEASLTAFIRSLPLTMGTKHIPTSDLPRRCRENAVQRKAAVLASHRELTLRH